MSECASHCGQELRLLRSGIALTACATSQQCKKASPDESDIGISPNPPLSRLPRSALWSATHYRPRISNAVSICLSTPAANSRAVTSTLIFGVTPFPSSDSPRDVYHPKTGSRNQ